MTTAQYVVQHDLNRVWLAESASLAIKVTKEAWMASAPNFHVRVCMQCGYTGDFTHIYNGAYPECPMCKGD